MKTTQEVVNKFVALCNDTNLSDNALRELLLCQHPAAKCFSTDVLKKVKHPRIVLRLLKMPIPEHPESDDTFIEEGAKLYLRFVSGKTEQGETLAWLNRPCKLSSLMKLMTANMDMDFALGGELKLNEDIHTTLVANVLHACHNFTLPSKN